MNREGTRRSSLLHFVGGRGGGGTRRVPELSVLVDPLRQGLQLLWALNTKDQIVAILVPSLSWVGELNAEGTKMAAR